jgi:hypothetical protein
MADNKADDFFKDNLKIDSKKVGIVIGTGGKNINKIRKDTGANINIKKINDSLSNCYINGTEAQVKDAKQYIEKVINQTIDKTENFSKKKDQYVPNRQERKTFSYNMTDFPGLPCTSSISTENNYFQNTSKTFSSIAEYKNPVEIIREEAPKSGMVDLKTLSNK